MSTTSDVDEFQSFDENSDGESGGEGSAASSLASDLHGRLKRPRTRPTQIRGGPCGILDVASFFYLVEQVAFTKYVFKLITLGGRFH